MKLNKHVEVCLTILLISVVPSLIAEKVYTDSTVDVSPSKISMCITGMLSNGVLVETNLENKIPMDASTNFRLECLNFSTRDSTLLIVYDTRISEDALVQAKKVEEIEGAFDGEWLKNLNLLIIFSVGLLLLAFEILTSRKRSQDIIKMIEKEAPLKGSVIDEESLLLLSSQNPEAYRKAVDMILKGELKVKRKKLKNLRKAFLKMIKIVNFRR